MASGTDTRWLTTKEAAAILRVHPKHVYRLLKQGLPASRVGGEWRFLASEIQAWSREGRQPAGYELPQLSTSNAQPLIAACDEPAILELLRLLRDGSRTALGLVEHTGGIEPLIEGQVMACAVTGDLPEAPPALLGRVHVAHVEYGLVTRTGTAPATLSGLGRRQARLASWPAGSDPRSVLEGVLAREGIDSRRAHHGSLEVRSHSDAIAAVVAGRADVAWTSRAWASKFEMPFVSFASRSLVLIVRAATLGDPTFVRCWEAMQSQAYRDAVRSLPGHDPSRAGEIAYLPRKSETEALSARLVTPPATREAPRGTRTGVRCAFVTRGHGQDASALMLRVVRALRKRGLAVCGCVQVPLRSRGKLSGYDLMRVGQTGSVPLARREPSEDPGFSAFRFDDATFEAARSWIKDDAPDARVVVIDALGALESKGAGHFEALAAALRSSSPGFVLASARRDLLPAILDRLGLPRSASISLDMPLNAAAEKRLVDRIARSAGA